MTTKEAYEIAKDLNVWATAYNDAVMSIMSGNLHGLHFEQIVQFDEMPTFEFLQDGLDVIDTFKHAIEGYDDLTANDIGKIVMQINQMMTSYDRFTYTRYEAYTHKLGKPDVDRRFLGAFAKPSSLFEAITVRDDTIGYVRIIRKKEGIERKAIEYELRTFAATCGQTIEKVKWTKKSCQKK